MIENFQEKNSAVEQTVERADYKSLAQFLSLAGIAAFLPFLIHIQWITGPLINAIFIIVLFLSGLKRALIVCIIPSLMALAGGLLPIFLAPAIPFIIASNILFVLAIDKIYNNSKSFSKGFWLAGISASILKFLFLFLCINSIVALFINNKYISAASKLFSINQLFTALLGCLIAWAILKFLKRF